MVNQQRVHITELNGGHSAMDDIFNLCVSLLDGVKIASKWTLLAGNPPRWIRSTVTGDVLVVITEVPSGWTGHNIPSRCYAMYPDLQTAKENSDERLRLLMKYVLL
jgi:hypothetical protein